MSHFPAPPGGRANHQSTAGAATSPRGGNSNGYSSASTATKNPRVARLAGFNDLLRELASAKGGSSSGVDPSGAVTNSGVSSSQRAVGGGSRLPAGPAGSGSVVTSMPTHSGGSGVGQMLQHHQGGGGTSPRGGGNSGGGMGYVPHTARAPEAHHHPDDIIPTLPSSARHLPTTNSSSGVHFGHSYQQQRIPYGGDAATSHHGKSSFLPTLSSGVFDEVVKSQHSNINKGGGAPLKYAPKPPSAQQLGSSNALGGSEEEPSAALTRKVSASKSGANKAPKPPQMPNPSSAIHQQQNSNNTAVSSRRSSAVQPSSHRESLTSAAAAAAATSPYLTPADVLDRHSSDLTTYERVEIKKFPEIYYYGAGAKKIDASGSSSSNNYGFDDDQGDYKVVNNDHVNYRFQILNELGRGSFGQVSRALDCKTQKIVALKIIKNKKKFHDQAVIEVEILKLLRDRDPEQRFNVVRMVDSFVFRSHMMVLFELHGMNLYELCKAVKFNPLPMPSIRQIAHQMLATLYYTRELKIVHCDLKPENVLLCLLDDDSSASMPKKRSNSSSALAAAQQRSNNNGAQKPMLVANGTVDLANPRLRVIDFGSSCHENKRMYTYIQSRFYRAPEVMLGIPYTPSIDMWSFGCILAELANGYPIFPGENEADQMTCIMEFLGAPPQDMIEKSPRRKYFFDTGGVPIMAPSPSAKSRSKQTQRPLKARKAKSKDLGTFLRSATKERDTLFADFVASCLEWDPVKRWSPQEAVKHPWMQFAATTPAFPPVEPASSTRSAAAHPHQDVDSRRSTPSSATSSKPATTRLPKIGR